MFAGSNPGQDKTTKIKKQQTVVLTTNPHLRTRVESTPETLCEKHFRPDFLKLFSPTEPF